MNDPSRTRFDTCQASHKCEAQTAGLTAYLAERLAGYHVDDLRSRKDEKGGNVKHCEGFSSRLSNEEEENTRQGFHSSRILRTM